MAPSKQCTTVETSRRAALVKRSTTTGTMGARQSRRLWRTLVIAAAIPALTLTLSGIASGQSVSHWGTYIGGTFETRERQTTPLQVPELTEVTAVDAGNSSGYALRADGTVWAWGNGESGQLGNGVLVNSPDTAVKVAIPPTVRIVAIGEAKNEGMAIDSTGAGWVWGENGSSSLCVSGRRIATPTIVPDMTATAVQGGEEHTLWLQPDGTVKGCGTNTHGQLGLGESVASAKRPTTLPGLSRVSSISAGSRTSAAVDSSGRVFAFGDNMNGAVGVGSSAPSIWTPTHVELPEPVTEVSAGGDLLDNGSMLALTTTHAVWGWGYDSKGQVGDGQKSSKPSPVNTGLHFASVVTGGVDSFGLDSEGTVWGWGSNMGGALGQGFTCGVFLAPVRVEGGASAISATAINVEDIHP